MEMSGFLINESLNEINLEDAAFKRDAFVKIAGKDTDLREYSRSH